MRLSSQFFQAEREYKAVYLQFKTACCLNWDQEEILAKAYQRAIVMLNHLKEFYPHLYKIYKNYEIKITGLYNHSVLFLWNERRLLR